MPKDVVVVVVDVSSNPFWLKAGIERNGRGIFSERYYILSERYCIK